MRLAPLPAAMFTRLLLLLCSCASVLAQSAAPTGVVDYVDTDEPTPEGTHMCLAAEDNVLSPPRQPAHCRTISPR